MTGVRRGTGVRALLTPAVVGAVAVAVVCAVVAPAVEGPSALGAVALGTALVLGFLLVGQLPVVQAAKGRGGLGALVLLLGYTTRIAVLLLTFRLVVRAGSPDRQVLGLTVMAVALGWTAGTVLAFLRWKPPVVDVDLPGDRQDRSPEQPDIPAGGAASAR